MAAPSYVAASAGATDAVSPATLNFAGATSGQIVAVQVLQDGPTAGFAWGVVNAGLAALDGTANSFTTIGTFAVGSATAALQHLIIGRATATNISINVSGYGSEDLYVRAYYFTDASTGTTLATVIENSTAGSTANTAATDGTITDAGVTTLGPDRLALNFVAINDDNVIAAFTGETGGDWTLAVSPYAESSGTDGAIGLQIAYPGIASWRTVNATANDVYGSGGTNEERAVAFTPGSNATATRARLFITKQGTPADSLIVEIQTDTGGSGPSGTVVGTGATVAAGSLTSGAWNAFDISASLSASTVYWLVARRSGARDTTNRYQLGYDAAGGYTGGSSGTRNSGSWSLTSGEDNAFSVETSTGATVNGGTATNSDATDSWGVVGFALIGTTVVDTTYYPRHPAHDFGSVTNF